jgi:V8-like Glu-specific endopeptidase
MMHLSPRLFIFFLLLVFISCGKPQSDEDARALVASVIVGELDWKEIHELAPDDPIRESANAVAVVSLASGGRCTGFMINEEVLMTNEHCVGSARDAKGLVATFLREAHLAEEDWVQVKCERFIGNNASLDYALVGCEGQPGSRFGHVTLSDEEVIGDESIYIVQQNCDYFTQRGCSWTKKVAFGDFLRKSGSSVVHNSDTLGGSSGSPVYSKQSHYVLALHHAGLGNNGQGRGIENYAVVMKDIVEDILSRFSHVELTLSSDASSQQPVNQHTSFEKAIQLKQGNYAIEQNGDQHFYQFKVSQSQRVRVRIDFNHRAGDLDLYLLNSRGQTIARSTGVTHFETITRDLSAGEYFVVVVGYRGAKGEYRLYL